MANNTFTYTYSGYNISLSTAVRERYRDLWRSGERMRRHIRTDGTNEKFLLLYRIIDIYKSSSSVCVCVLSV